MAWIKSHSELMTHPKVKKAARLLGISAVTMVGHLHALWWWAMDHAPDGLISAYDPEEIADAVMWEGDIQVFLDALTGCGAKDCPGLLDVLPGGELVIHDWEEHCGKEYEKRAKDAERMRSYRAQKKEKRSCGVHRTYDERNTNETSTYDTRSANVRREKEKEKEIEKKNKNTRVCLPEINPDQQGANPPAENSPEDGDGARKDQSGKGIEYLSEFEDFWREYPRRKEKAKAYRCWKVERKRGAPGADLVRAARNYARECRAKCTEERYIKHGATFLGPDRPWLDYLTPAGSASSPPSQGPPDSRTARLEEFEAAQRERIMQQFGGEST